MKYMEDVGIVSAEMVETMNKKLKDREGIVLTTEQEDKIFESIFQVLEQYCETGEYKSHL